MPEQAPQQTPPTNLASGTSNGAPTNGAAFALPPEVAKAYPGLTKFKDLASLAKGYGELEKFSSGALRLPAADAPQEEKDAFYSKLGRPESADKYEIKFGEGVAVDDKLLGSFRDTAHKLGLSQGQAQALGEWWAGQSEGILASGTAQREAQVVEWNKELDTEWGWQKDRNTALAGRALASMLDGKVDHPIVKLFDESGLGNHPVVLKFFYEQALKQGEDKLITEPTAPTADDQVNAKSQINEIRGNKEHPYNLPRHPSHKEAVAHMARLYEVAYPKEG